MKRLLSLAAAAAIIIGGTVAIAAPPQVNVVGPTDLFQDIVGGNPQVGNVYASALQLAGFEASLPSRGNVLIGGDATTNLWQRATTGASVTTTITYGGPDRWAYWSGTGTAMTVSRDSTAADIGPGYQYAFKMARTSGQTGVVQMCMVQEVESVNSYQFQGATAELDFHAVAGANFSAASSNMTAYIVTGTGTDEGISKLAFQFNGGGGGSSTWAGQANATAAVIPISTVNNRYAAVATIPATATEIAVILCDTPVGTAGTNDYIAFSGIQLVRNPALASSVSTTAGYNCSAGVIICTGFDRRNQGIESALQYRYYYQITESATAAVVEGSCVSSTTSISNCFVKFPQALRVAPTMTYATGFLASAQSASTSGFACTGLTTSATVTGFGPSTTGVLIDCASSAAGPAAGTSGWFWDAGTGTPTGAIKASAEL
jgi:hypothetical protein